MVVHYATFFLEEYSLYWMCNLE